MSHRTRSLALASTSFIAALVTGLFACSSTGGGDGTGAGNATGASGAPNGAGGSVAGVAGGAVTGGASSFAGTTSGVGGNVVGTGGVPNGAAGSAPSGGGTTSVGGMSAMGGTGGAPIVCQPEQNRCDCHTSVGLAIINGSTPSRTARCSFSRSTSATASGSACPAAKPGP